MEENSFFIYIVKTTAGQEKSISQFMGNRIVKDKLSIASIFTPGALKGYIFVEAENIHEVERATNGLRHFKPPVMGKIPFSEIEKYLITKPVVEELDVGYMVEITGGPFKGMNAKVIRINKVRQEATLELLEASYTLPITVHTDYLKLVEKSKNSNP